MPTLVIIDVQPKDRAVTPTLIQNVCELVRIAKEEGSAIVVLEYLPNSVGHTCKEIKNEIGDYEQHCIRVKNDFDGSDIVIEQCFKHGFDSENFRVCGVHSDCCVACTVHGLIDRHNATVEIVRNACNSTSLNAWSWADRKRQTALV